MTNVEKVWDIYKAFGEGDIPRILSYLAPSVEWEYGPNSTTVPWLQPRRGAAEVTGFFESLGAMDFHRFVPKRVVGSDDLVISLVDVEATVKATGRRFVEEDETHIWYFDHTGKVIRFRHRVDTHQHQLAYRPE
jgi:ketosteroid isomerase-like protein